MGWIRLPGCGAILIQPLLLQASVILMERFEPEAALKIIERERVTLQNEFPRLSGGIKIKKFGNGGLAELAAMDESREAYRKS